MDIKPAKNIGPGEIIIRYISYRGWSRETLRGLLCIEEEELEDLIDNKKKIDHEVAEKLSIVFKNSKDFWLSLSENYFKHL